MGTFVVFFILARPIFAPLLFFLFFFFLSFFSLSSLLSLKQCCSLLGPFSSSSSFFVRPSHFQREKYAGKSRRTETTTTTPIGRISTSSSTSFSKAKGRSSNSSSDRSSCRTKSWSLPREKGKPNSRKGRWRG